jgi:biopolymer transport protein TolR
MAFSPQSRGGSSLYRPLAEINVTPLVDVMLVLLIIFMVTAPMLATGIKVNLPQAKQAQPLDPKDPVVVTIAKDGKLSVNNDETDKAGLIDAVCAKLAGDLTRIIHLRGDKEVPYGDVVAIMDLLATNGLTHIAIVADARSISETAPKTAGAKAIPANSTPATASAPATAVVPGADTPVRVDRLDAAAPVKVDVAPAAQAPTAAAASPASPAPALAAPSASDSAPRGTGAK